MVLRNGCIHAVGERAIPADARPIDGRGGYLIPGYWDMHVPSFKLSPQLHLPLQLANGITSVRDMMDCPETADSRLACVADKRQWTARADTGEMASPRFVEVASFHFNRPDLQPDDVPGVVDAYRARGVDTLKVYDRLSRPAYDRLFAEAKRTTMSVVGYVPRAVPMSSFRGALHARPTGEWARSARRSRLPSLKPWCASTTRRCARARGRLCGATRRLRLRSRSVKWLTWSCSSRVRSSELSTAARCVRPFLGGRVYDEQASLLWGFATSPSNGEL